MPLYEYDCERCGPFEASQKITEPALDKHSCGAKATRKISRSTFTLKGGGWYADGYKSTGASSGSSGSKSASS
jgi:putative FmdB family regulatory protein